MRTALTVTAVAALTAVAIAGTATAASATPTSSTEVVGIVKTTTRGWSHPVTSSAPMTTLAPDTPVLVRCWTDGEPVYGNPLWLRVTPSGTPVFVPAHTTPDDPAAWSRVPSCVA